MCVPHKYYKCFRLPTSASELQQVLQNSSKCNNSNGTDLQKQIELAKELKENYDVIGSQIMYIDESGKCPTKWGSGPMLEIGNEKISALTKAYNNQVANSSTLIKKSSLKEVGGWDESLPALEDMELWIRMIEAGHKFINIDEILVMHRIHDNSNFNQKNWNPTELFSKK